MKLQEKKLESQPVVTYLRIIYEYSLEFFQLRLKFVPPSKLNCMESCLLSNKITWEIGEIFDLKLSQC